MWLSGRRNARGESSICCSTEAVDADGAASAVAGDGPHDALVEVGEAIYSRPAHQLKMVTL
jgi:hypothetical protein